MLAVCFALPAHAGLFDDKITEADNLVTKGKELQSVKMYDDAKGHFRQAEQLLRQAIIDDPKNPETHYRAGMVYLELGDAREAENRFKTAKDVLKSGEYTKKIGDYYLKSYKPLLAQGNVKQAKNNADKAAYYNPANKEIISKECFETGKNYLNQGQFDLAGRYFDFLGALGGGWGDKVQELYFAAGQEASEQDEKISNYLKAAKYGHSKDKDISKELLKIGDEASDDDCLKIYEMAWNISPVRTPETQKAGERLNQIGRDVLDIKDPPDPLADSYVELATKMAEGIKPFVVVYKRGEKKVFELKKGEYSDHYIRKATGTTYGLQIKTGTFGVKTKSGKKYMMGNVPELYEDFKIFCTEDCIMRVVIR